MIKKIIFILVFLIFCQISFSQTFKFGISLFSNYSNHFKHYNYWNIEEFEVSDYQFFGKGKENLESRMKFYQDERIINQFSILNQISFFGFMFEYKQICLNLRFSEVFDANIGYNLYENKIFYFNTLIGYNTKKFNKKIGELIYLDNYQYPIYGLYNNKEINLACREHNFYTELRLNIKIA